jgi:DNA-binding transcriptional LysR family regulator
MRKGIGMAKENYNELLSFLTVARERSFTRAAAQLGVSQSALSHTIRGLEERLGLRLLTRTTRSVAPTEAGERLVRQLHPHFEGIDSAVAALGEWRDKPSGTLRITSGEHAATTVLWPVLEKFLRDYPQIHVEVVTEARLVDIVDERYDAGIRLGEQVAKDMVAMPIAPPMRLVVVGAPSYLDKHPAIKTPRDLTRYDCINIRFLTHGGLYAWEFEKRGQALNVRVEGRLTFTHLQHILTAAIAGFGLAYLPEDMVVRHVAKGKLRIVLDDWCPKFPGYHIYYPNRRQHSPAFVLLLEALKKHAAR